MAQRKAPTEATAKLADQRSVELTMGGERFVFRSPNFTQIRLLLPRQIASAELGAQMAVAEATGESVPAADQLRAMDLMLEQIWIYGWRTEGFKDRFPTFEAFCDGITYDPAVTEVWIALQTAFMGSLEAAEPGEGEEGPDKPF